MAKRCSVCGRKLGVFDGKVSIADGTVCLLCWAGAGYDMSFRSMCAASKKTTNQLRDLIEIEILKQEALKAGLQQQAGFTGDGCPVQLPDSSYEKGTPVDITFGLDQNHGVDFSCTGQPWINFDDLIQGKEMIIGDGYVRNRSNHALPDVRIVCEVDPPVFDPGSLYYEEGTFEAGFNGKFEIDDPPVNLEEYAKIQTICTGKMSFTLYFGAQKIHTTECPLKIEPAPKEKMQALQNVILYEEEKNAPGPVNVFLYARGSNVYEMDLMRKPELLYSMYSNGQEQLIGDVFVTNETAYVLKNVKFEAKFTSDILSPVKILLGDVPPGQQVTFEVDDPAIDIDKLEALTEVELCTATYRILVNGRTVAESTGKITICPYDQWNSAMVLLPAYMTPNHPGIIQVLQHASGWMRSHGKAPSLEGYQGDPKRIDEMVCGVYHAIKEADIIYSNPPASFFGPQRIRLCETVLAQKFATCMDMTILFASCLESIGLHPLLLTAPGHIFAGVWMTETRYLKEPVVSDAKLIRQMIQNKEIMVVECTAMNTGKEVTYEEAKSVAEQTIMLLAEKNIEDHECIDVQIVRAIGIKPFPIRKARFAEVSFAEMPSPVAKADLSDHNKVPEQSVSNYKKEAYESFSDDLSNISIENFYEKQSRKLLKDAIEKIVSIEGPVSQQELIRTLVDHTNLGRVTRQVSEHLDKLVTGTDVKITRQNGMRFLWPHGADPTQYLTYRFKEKRKFEDICKYELKNAVCYLIQENGPMTKAELQRGMTSLMGYSRASKRIEEGADLSIKYARELKKVQKRADGKYDLIQFDLHKVY